MTCDTAGGGGGGAACGEFELAITKTKSRLLVLFDRSCSMNTTLTKLNDASKWDIAVDAFAQLATLPAMPQFRAQLTPFRGSWRYMTGNSPITSALRSADPLSTTRISRRSDG